MAVDTMKRFPKFGNVDTSASSWLTIDEIAEIPTLAQLNAVEAWWNGELMSVRCAERDWRGEDEDTCYYALNEIYKRRMKMDEELVMKNIEIAKRW